MHLNRQAVPLLIVPLCFLGGSYVVSSSYQSQTVSSASPTGLKAFVIHQRELSFSRDSKQPPAVTDFTIAQSGDGSRTREFTISGRWSPNGREGTSVDIWNIAKRRYINVEPFTQSISTFPMSDERISDLLRSAHACEDIRPLLASGNLPSKTMLGYRVFEIVKREQDPITSTSWVAPDLNCFPLKKTEVYPGGYKNDWTVVKLVEGEPPASMFTPPAGYMERSPAQVETLYEKLFGGKELYPKQMAEHAEREYRKGR